LDDHTTAPLGVEDLPADVAGADDLFGDTDTLASLGDASYDDDFPGTDRQSHRRRALGPRRKPKRLPDDVVRELADQYEAGDRDFDPTYAASRHEAAWIQGALGPFYQEGIIADVLRLVKGGKEATVYQCAAGPAADARYIAAKVYRPRQFRNLRNDARYREGRGHLTVEGKQLRDTRVLRAIFKGTDKGKELQHESWVAHEMRALELLHAAGVSVPRPVAGWSNAIAMEYIGADDRAAPALSEVALTPREAERLYPSVRRDIETMLAHGVIHGDLSPFNILVHHGRAVIIDLPQVVRPDQHRGAFDIFARDVLRVVRYFRARGVGDDPDELAATLWRRYVPDDLWIGDLVPAD
jgi:RIO kinase 1